MAKRITIIKNTASSKKAAPVKRDISGLSAILQNASTIRSSMLTKLFDDRRDIDVECGYPKDITIEQYDTMYRREGIAQRVVTLLPGDSWSEDPEVYEVEDSNLSTEFEQAWNDLVDQKNIFHYLHRVDELSGIGRFGILILGFDDGQPLDQPVARINERGEMSGEGKKAGTLNLVYLRALSESNVVVKAREIDPTNPRFGQPTLYTVTFQDDINSLTSSEVKAIAGDISASAITSTDKVVHWSRILHVADNRKTSEVYGSPRMEPVFNRLLDIRKVLSGSGEMFWKGAFPGYSFEMSPEAAADGATLDSESLRTEFDNYSNGLQRYLALTGLSAKSLAPQVSDPTNHIETQMRAIAITLGVPYRIFLGTEEAKLASSQDVKTWNKRINKRQDKYVTPLILRPFVDRLIAVGVLPAPADANGYTITWPDLNAPTDQDKAGNAKTIAEALAKYLGGQVDTLIPPEEWLGMVMGMSVEEVKQIMTASETYIAETEMDREEEAEEMRRQEAGVVQDDNNGSDINI